MADTKITALTALTAADPANDVIPIVDVSDTTMAASGTTKKISVNNILGASGTATLASAAITGAATVGTTLGVTGVSTLASATITGLATVGTTFAVGTVTPDVFGRFYTRSIGFNSSGTTGLQINGTTYGTIDLGSNGVRTFGIVGGASDVNISTVTNIPMNFNINSATKMTLNTAGNLAFQTGKGIDFSAVTGGTGTATANVLNDYEEGTWTGTLKGGTTDPTTAVTATGQYTKIGNQVFARILFSNIITTGASGAITVTGLPFANGSNRTIGSTLCDLIATFTGSPICWVGGTGTTLNYQASNSNGAASDLTHNAGTGRYFYSNIVYTV